MKPSYDLNNLIKKHKANTNQRFPGDAAHVRESVSLSMDRKPKKRPGFVEHTKVNEKVTVSLQNKK